VEVVNMQELRAMEQSRVPFYASNLSVGLSISVAGFGMQVATGGWGPGAAGALHWGSSGAHMLAARGGAP
jgi:ABC-type enterochelin transport system permease subunit